MKTKTKNNLKLKPEERFLFEKLPDVLRLEAAMKAIRRKYSQFWDDIGRRVQAKHPELNHWCNQASGSYALVGIGRDCWPSSYSWPSGLYIESISFESLLSPDTDAPRASIWIKPPKGMRIDLETFKEPVRRKAQRLTSELGLQLVDNSTSDIDLGFDLPESRDELLGMLMKKKEAQFADCMVSHFATLAKVIPLIDEVYNSKRSRA